MTVSDAPLSPLTFLDRSADVWAERPAVVDGPRRFTYAEHAERVRRAAGALRAELGVRAGDRVATLLPNAAAMLELHYAVPGVGGVLVPLNTRLAAQEYAYVLGHSGATVLVALESMRELVEDACDELGDGAPRVVWVGPEGDDASEYEQLLDGAEPVALERPEDERTLLSINYTSGTTGQAEGRHDDAPRRHAAQPRRGLRGRPVDHERLPVDAADVPLQRLGIHVGGHRDGRHARLPAQGRAGAHLARPAQRGRHPPVRRARPSSR